MNTLVAALNTKPSQPFGGESQFLFQSEGTARGWRTARQTYRKAMRENSELKVQTGAMSMNAHPHNGNTVWMVHTRRMHLIWKKEAAPSSISQTAVHPKGSSGRSARHVRGKSPASATYWLGICRRNKEGEKNC